MRANGVFGLLAAAACGVPIPVIDNRAEEMTAGTPQRQRVSASRTSRAHHEDCRAAALTAVVKALDPMTPSRWRPVRCVTVVSGYTFEPTAG